MVETETYEITRRLDDDGEVDTRVVEARQHKLLSASWLSGSTDSEDEDRPPGLYLYGKAFGQTDQVVYFIAQSALVDFKIV